MTTNDPHAQPGVVVADKYVVEEVLGSGAMGIVVAARHKLIGRRVAIKFMRLASLPGVEITPAARKEALARFTREARALVSVESDHVVRVFDYGNVHEGSDDSPYLVMEMLTGHDLLKELRARGQLPLGEAAEIVYQACLGLEAVHASGIIHRDIKPANLFLTARADGKLLVKIVDFGISKITKKMSEDELSLTMESTAIGSPHYMSPEQLRDAKNVDGRSDVWSLGVILHRALTGTLPFEGDSVGSLMGAVIADAPQPVRAVRPELPPEIGAIVQRCLEKKAALRFASARELGEALLPYAQPSDGRRVLERVVEPAKEDGRGATHSSLSAPLTATGPSQRRSWRRRIVLAAAIVLPLLLVGSALVLRPRHAPSAPASTSARAPEASSPMAITDAPPPATQVREAAAAYQAGLQAIRDASLIVARHQFERAATLDPTMAAAHLRIALYGEELVGAAARHGVQKVIALRASLSDRDRALLTVLEPLYLLPTPDRAEAMKRIDAIAAERPNDVEVQFLALLLFWEERTPAEALRTSDRLVAMDSRFAGAVWVRSLVESVAGDDALALRTVDRCLATSPAAGSCLRVRAGLEESSDCAALEADAQRMVTTEGDSYRAHDYMARALVARGKSIDAVREALQRKWAATPAASRTQTQLSDETHLAILRGDFAAADKALRAREAFAATSGTEADRGSVAVLRSDLLAEMGDAKGAAKIADAFLRRRGASPANDDLNADPRPHLYAVAVRGGVRTDAERDAARAEWLDAWSARLPRMERSFAWIDGYATSVESHDEAEEALAALPEYAPLPARALRETNAVMGRIYVLAERPEDALPELRAAAASCNLLESPAPLIRNGLYLGMALEKTGDREGACAAYATVTTRWGHAIPRSMTAQAATVYAKALGCVL